MITYTWKNIELQCHKKMYGLTDVVFAITGDFIASLNGVEEVKTITVGIGVPNKDNYIVASEVTKDMAINWIESSLDISKLKQELENRFFFTRIRIED